MEFYEHLKSYLSDEEIKVLKESLNDTQKHGLLLNTNKLSKEKFLELFPNVKPHPLVKNGFIYDKNEYEFGKNILHELGAYYLQEPSAMIVSLIANPKPGETVLDLCAAPGGKTVQASMLMEGQGVLYSNDLSHQRCQVLLENVERMGLSNVIICNNDFEKIYDKYLNFFDKIILDAPCSGSGMFRKDDKMFADWSYAKVLKFAEIQKRLITIAFKMLKPCGELIYSTCSFSKEEDEDVVNYLLNTCDNAALIDISNENFYINKKENIGVHLMPFKFEGEGHYIAKLRKKYSLDTYSCSNNTKKYQPATQWFKDFKFIMPQPCKVTDLNILRYGVKAVEKKGKDEMYCHHLSHTYLPCAPIIHTCELSYNCACEYINGQTLNIICPKGPVLLTYLNIPIGYGKSDGRIIKNHYPKYLRNKHFI